MTTAFQRNAFQNNAFQIDLDGEGGAGKKKKKHGLTQLDVSQLLEEYKEALSLKIEPEVEHKIISAINPFVYPENTQEIERYQRAAFLFDTLPQPQRINFELLQSNKISLDRLRAALNRVKEFQEEEELCLLLMLASY